MKDPKEAKVKLKRKKKLRGKKRKKEREKREGGGRARLVFWGGGPSFLPALVLEWDSVGNT